MKKLLYISVLLIAFVSCKNEAKKELKEEVKFPSELAKVFEKHGGLNKWKATRTLSFNKGEESHTTDLWTRKAVVQAPKYSLGFDGDSVWLAQKEEKAYKGNPTFYYNLYFYFYAMPFVLADDGIIYEKTDDLVFEGKKYPGFKISYKANVGTSPDDNYFIYYNPETYQMEWLGYTVTYFSKKVSDRISLIKYHDWNSVNGLILPKAITWYKKGEDGMPTEPRGPATEFTLATASNKSLKDTFYQKPTE